MPLEIVAKDPATIKAIKTALEADSLFVKPIIKEGTNRIIRTSIDEPKQLLTKFPDVEFREYQLDLSKKGQSVHGRDILSFHREYFSSYIKDLKILEEELLFYLPTKYSIYPPMLLFNNSEKKSLLHEKVQQFFTNYNIDRTKYYKHLLNDFAPFKGLEIIAINKPILEEDTLRQPHNLQLLYRNDNRPLNEFDDIWCQVIQNEIIQVWNPMYTMFSRGNIKEKKRILDTFKEVENNDVVDLYCGIGYFTFSYLKLGCRNLFGFELNPWSVKGLWQGFNANNKFKPTLNNGKCITTKLHRNEGEYCHIYNENNEMSNQRLQEFRDQNMAGELLKIRHINLGLLPSSQQGWPVAILLLDNHNNWGACPLSTLHIHENVSIQDINDGSFIKQTLLKLHTLGASRYQFNSTHLEKIKTFAPDVWHICLDVDVTLAPTLT
ncbi:similar to Saccharomyces cerevisiae YML005W TRM12 S-adenosylmethionine-dependent methyltransferase of the seven beta-strand family [Maudiozyma saulgeensis]|uniref:tRNA wybutosine-synthesizing protein 2 n=1 Tax=Maudiozyma saulgeensis TaxID=1789683 RepID=A0A1X7R9B2_9SACH|nr:similar to Saccharomyces cerevisiae YML005W TRM12 S-adenosylmethionine-dependent methyltransferase of the seven beta-strand family [Kazachstania saulgeensis]